MWTIELYRIDVVGETFTRIAVSENYKGLGFTQRKNRIGSGIFTLDIFDAIARREYLIPFRTQVLIKYNGSYRWAGYISSLDISMRNVTGKVKVECIEIWGHLATRFTDKIKEYGNTDAGDIAWDLIDTTQNTTNGFLGFYEGSITTTINRDRTYESKRISDAIMDLTDVIGGFDYDYTIKTDSDNLYDGVYFNVYDRLGTVRTTTLELGENVQDVALMLNGDIINTVTAYGAGTGEDIITSTDSDATSQIGYTRREKILVRSDISIQETLDGHTQKAVDDSAGDEYKYQLTMNPARTPVYGALNLGDRVNIKLKTQEDSFLNVERTAIIEEITVNVDENGVGFVTYTVET